MAGRLMEVMVVMEEPVPRCVPAQKTDCHRDKSNMTVTQCYVPETRVFSSHLACQTALQNVLAQAVANMKVNAVCMDL